METPGVTLRRDTESLRKGETFAPFCCPGENPGEFDYVTPNGASIAYIKVFKDLVERGLPGGVDACDPELYKTEQRLINKYTRADGAVVAEYFVSTPQDPEPVCDRANDVCEYRQVILDINSTDVMKDGTTTNQRSETRHVTKWPAECDDVCGQS